MSMAATAPMAANSEYLRRLRTCPLPFVHAYTGVPEPDDAALLACGAPDPLPDAPGERESPACIRRGLSSAQLKPSEAPLPDAPGEPDSLACIRRGISSAQLKLSEASVRGRTLARKPARMSGPAPRRSSWSRAPMVL